MKKAKNVPGSAAAAAISDTILPSITIRKTTTFRLKPEDMETGDPISMTIPDQSMEMRDIYQRFATGRPVDGTTREPMYFGDLEVPDLKKLDLVEIGQLLEENRERLESLKTKLTEEQEAHNLLEAEKAAKAKEEEDKRLLDLVYKQRKTLLDER